MASKFADLSDQKKQEKAEELAAKIKDMENEVHKGFVGQEDVIHKIMLTVVAGGNILLEGVPGLGKSLLVELLGQIVEGSEFNRIQFTPDKLPSDIVGVEAYNEDKGFYVEKGPIFANFILADEINRAPPKVQSAMLEAMQEHKVSIGDETFHLPEPFFTMATQNPVEQGGSLHPEETLYMNGELWKAENALKHAKQEGELIHEDNDKRIYDAGDFTNNLSVNGEIEETSCMVYEKDYSGKAYTVTTRTGRRIKVNGDHPFLVNESGRLVWKRAEEIQEGDFLVCPEVLDLPEEGFPSHKETIEKLDEEFRTVTADDVEDAKRSIEERDFSYEDVDALRIASHLTKKELAEKSGISYDRTLNYLSGTSNGIGEELAEVLKQENIEPSSYIESHKTHQISDSWNAGDAGFFLGFTLAEGNINNNSVEVSQKNYPELIERWISLAEKAGLEVNTRMKDGVKHAKVRSKPFIRYLEERYRIDKPETLLNAPEEFKKEFIDAFMQAESYFENDKEEDNIRITMTQNDRETINLISHMLIDFGIRPAIYDQERVYRLRVSGKDLKPYMDRFTWPGEEPEVVEGPSAYRVLPVESEMIDELVSILGFKYSGDMTERDWYSLYHMAKQRGRVSEHELKNFVDLMEDTVEERKIQEHNSVQKKAQSCGIAITEIVEETELSKHMVWQTYKNEDDTAEVEQFVKQEREKRLKKAEQIISYLKKLVESDVFYDPVQEIKSEEYEGPVIGLSVPKSHNYVAGLGACGINHNTYPLPEAQIDRFLFKIYLPYPKKKSEQKIIDLNANIMDMEEDFNIQTAVEKQDVLDMQEFSKVVNVSQEIKAYIVDLVDASRNPEDYGLEYSDYIDWGCTPRASINLALAARANALYNERTYVTPEDIREVIRDVFIHRIILNYEGEAEGLEVEDIIQDIVDNVPVR